MQENNGRLLLTSDEETKWRVRHDQLAASHHLAGLFRGWVPEGFEDQHQRILYVGKATSGSFDVTDAERRYFNGKGAFWNFAKQIAIACNCSEVGIPCIAWSNISKLSGQGVKAEPWLVKGFEEQAAASLEAEIVCTRPQIVVFVTNHFSDLVVRAVSGGHEDSAWSKSENDSNQNNIWWRRREDGVAMLWMRHPMGAPMAQRVYAAGKIAALVGLSEAS
jgi:hypothetical protein